MKGRQVTISMQTMMKKKVAEIISGNYYSARHKLLLATMMITYSTICSVHSWQKMMHQIALVTAKMFESLMKRILLCDVIRMGSITEW